MDGYIFTLLDYLINWHDIQLRDCLQTNVCHYSVLLHFSHGKCQAPMSGTKMHWLQIENESLFNRKRRSSRNDRKQVFKCISMPVGCKQ